MTEVTSEAASRALLAGEKGFLGGVLERALAPVKTRANRELLRICDGGPNGIWWSGVFPPLLFQGRVMTP